MPEYTQLPNELKSLVRFTIDILGECIKQSFGQGTYALVEMCRKEMAKSRSASSDQKMTILQNTLDEFKQLNKPTLYELAHSFSLYMELVNRCETAYRHHRLRSRPVDLSQLNSPYSIIFVFTAHPTEARSSAALKLLKEIELLLIHKLKSSSDKKIEMALKHLIMLLMRLPLSIQKKPTVADEAYQLYSIILDRNILLQQIELKKQNVTIQFRTWVGGDKDGHPHVNAETMLESWNFSRSAFLSFITEEMKSCVSLLSIIPVTDDLVKLKLQIKEIQAALKVVQKLEKFDGKKVQAIRKSFEKLAQNYLKAIKVKSPHIDRILELFWLYPALVVPLEIREDSSLVAQALKDKNLAVVKMLKNIKLVSYGELDKWYVRGFVISMTESSADLIAGQQLLIKTLGKYAIPVVPLFETRKALENGVEILNESFKSNRDIAKVHQEKWGNRFEVMLGYSDSSKESGVIESRLLIANALQVLDQYLEGQKLVPVFFHGSGGSIERGGGSIKDQTSWWPKSALNTYKSTIQGEMVSRNFGDSWIMESMVTKIVENFNLQAKSKQTHPDTNLLKQFAASVAREYQSFLSADGFIHFIKAATPYAYLDELKIGSRPSKRQKEGAEFKLRAIPWVLCWTQTRILFPTWWGIGSTWTKLDSKAKSNLVKQAQNNKLFTAFLHSLGFTLAKVELEVFQLYLNENLSADLAKKYIELFRAEYQSTLEFYQEVSSKKELLWFKPWLKESIELRSPMIHPLNLIQILALKEHDPYLLRETVTGISCGMMTTG